MNAKPVVVYSRNSNDFRSKVVEPIISIYSDSPIISLQEAVTHFRLDDGKWNEWDTVVVVEISSEAKEEPANSFDGSLSSFPPITLLRKLIFECEQQFLPIIACCNDVESNILKILRDAKTYVYMVPTDSFDSARVADVCLHRRAGLISGKLNSNEPQGLPEIDDSASLPKGELMVLLQLELPSSPDQFWFVKVVCDILGKNVSALIEVVMLMRTARFLARLELEGRPYTMTFFLGTILPHQNKALLELGDSKRILLDKTAIPQLEDLAEMAQGSGCFVGVDPANGYVTGIFEFPINNEAERLYHFTELAKQFQGGIVFNLPGNNTVESYTKDGLILRYDGFEWICQPFFKLNYELKKLGLNKPIILHLMEVINQLSLRRLASIIAIDPYSFENEDKVTDFELNGLRSTCIPTWKQLLDIDVETLVSIFRLDGAHLIKGRGGCTFHKIAQKVTKRPQSKDDGSSSPGGTGRLAAKALSEAFPFAAVVKVSASGGRIMVNRGTANAQTLARVIEEEESAEIRAEAAKEAANIFNDKERKTIIPALRHAAEDPDSYVRIEAISSLGTYDDYRDYDLIAKALVEDSSQYVRSAAVDSIAGFRQHPKLIELLMNALKDDEKYHVVRVAARHLGELGDKKAVNPLLEALAVVITENHGPTVAAIAKALSQICEIGDTMVIESLIKILEENPHAEARAAAAEALGKIGDLRAVPVLEAARIYKSDSFFQQNSRKAAETALMAIHARGGNGFC